MTVPLFLTLTFCVRLLGLFTLPFLLLLSLIVLHRIPCSVTSLLSCPLIKLTSEGALAVDECRLALLGMVKRKDPGFDGLPMEFWDVLGNDLVRVLNVCYDLCSLSRKAEVSFLWFLRR